MINTTTQQIWNLVWQEGPYDNHTAPGGFGIDPRIDVAATRVPAASKEDSHPQAILKFQPRYSFDYRVHYEPQLKQIVTAELKKALYSRNVGEWPWK